MLGSLVRLPTCSPARLLGGDSGDDVMETDKLLPGLAGGWMPAHNMAIVAVPMIPEDGRAHSIKRCVRCGMTAGEISQLGVPLCPVALGQWTKRAEWTSCGRVIEQTVMRVY